MVLHAHQQLTQEWWQMRRGDFGLFASPLVLDEAGAGEPEMVRRRMEALEGVPPLAPTSEAVALAKALTTRGPLPAKAEVDALHIAIAAVHGCSTC